MSNTSNSSAWWKEAVIYQIYPRSFKDSNDDGIGDLQGIILKLDYIKSLGVDAVWLNPIFSSPNDDNGYDISDYRNIMHEFGTMRDFDELLQGMHERGLKLILDLVANHTSDEHEWFKQSRSSRDNPYRHYYHWWPAEKGKPAARYSFFDVESNAWKYDAQTDAYYLHYFSVKQPDLNWENSKVRNEIYDIMRFWFDKGVDGFRMDVILFISKDTNFPELPEKYHGDFIRYYAEGPHLHEYLHEMYKEVLSKYNVMSVAEGVGVKTNTAMNFVDPDRNELNMLYHFDAIDIGYLQGVYKTIDPKGFDLLEFKKIYSEWNDLFSNKGWGTIYLCNHDRPRMVTRWGNDSDKFRELTSKMLTTFLLTMRATPFYYNGDELGMTNAKFDRIEDYRDIETLNMYKQIEAHGGDIQQFLEAQKLSARDNSRTPFQWNDTLYAGFSDGVPWIKVNSNYTTIYAEQEEKDENSCLNYFRKLIQLRKQTPTLIYGKYTLLDKENTKVYAYTRELNDDKFLVLLNFSKDNAAVNSDIKIDNAKMFICNYDEVPERNDGITLRPYEAVVYEL
jgi:oligo-1,6-glucosidase